jgi:glycerate dehydrogenase
MRGVFLDLASLAEQDLDLSGFDALFDDWQMYPRTLPAERLDRIGNADVVVTNKVVIDEATLTAAAQLKLVCLTATGYNNVAIDSARERGIVVSNAVGYATDSVAQHVFALILAHHTRLFEYNAAVRRGDWSRSSQFGLLDYPVRELRGMTLGIVGHGELGQGVGRLAEAFGMRVLVSQRPGGSSAPGRVALEQVLRESDVLTLHVPLLDSTHHLIDADALASMKPTALLINTARGAVVDNAALAEALRRGQIGGAGIDVLDVEPPPLDHPLLAEDVPNLIVTPHSAWAGRQARQNVVDETIANIKAFQNGSPRNRVV